MATNPRPIAEPDPALIADLVTQLESVAASTTPTPDTEASAYQNEHLAAPNRDSPALWRWLARLRPFMAARTDRAGIEQP